MISPTQIFALGVVWVGGWGFLFFTNPAFICRLGTIKNPTAKKLKFIKVMGAVELSLVFTGAVLTAIFGLKS
jgi:hypothetical protein